MQRRKRGLVLTGLLVSLCLLAPLLAQKRKNKKDEEPRPQVLAALPETPEAVSVETGRLTFEVSPLSDKGLLSQQVRDALKALEHQAHGGTMVKLRAFVAGSGDLRRVKDIVSEEFTDRKQPLPAVTTIQVGALPLIGAQVVMEGMAADRKVVNPNGLAFFSGTRAKNPAEAMTQLKLAAQSAGMQPRDMLRITCFLSSLEQWPRATPDIEAAFPIAALNFVQLQRLGIDPQVTCEAVGRLTTPPLSAVSIVNGVALVNARMLVMTAAQLAFRDQESDYQLAFQRLIKTLGGQSVTPKEVFWTGIYSLTRPTADAVESIRWQFLDQKHPPAGTSLLFEGLPSTDATAAIEAVAAK